jgi:hypothetical protein
MYCVVVSRLAWDLCGLHQSVGANTQTSGERQPQVGTGVVGPARQAQALFRPVGLDARRLPNMPEHVDVSDGQMLTGLTHQRWWRRWKRHRQGLSGIRDGPKSESAKTSLAVSVLYSGLRTDIQRAGEVQRSEVDVSSPVGPT